MYILAIDTTGPVGTVCLGTVPESTFPVKVTTETMSHLRNLMPMISELLEDQKVDKSDIKAVAASCGPGSFTGIAIAYFEMNSDRMDRKKASVAEIHSQFCRAVSHYPPWC